jgi:hypothetical protein
VVVIAVVAPHAPTIVVVVRAVVVVVVDALSSPASFDGVSGVAVGPETALDRRRRGSDSVPVAEEEVDSGCGLMEPQPARAPSAGVRLSFPLVVLS